MPHWSLAPSLGGGCTRCFPNTIEAYIDSFTELDVDDSGTIEALTDALMILRYMFGFRGPDADRWGLHGGALRAQVEANIAPLMQ